MASIFVSIASYRDPELLPTIRDLLNNLSKENTVKIIVGWQHNPEDDWDTFGEFGDDKRFIWIDTDYRDSRGVCNIRHLIQKGYQDEDYYLQLDSHHRFAKNWDKTLIKWVKSLQKKGHEKPVISTYLPQYFPNNDPQNRIQEVWIQNIDRFLPQGTAFLVPVTVHDHHKYKKPIPARFISAHFIFTIGQFVKEVPYDPNLYFQGEESSLAARAYTFGYDLFCPHRPIAWHEYHRDGKPKHWDDGKIWEELDKTSYDRYRKLMGMDPGCTGCQRRSLAPDYFGKVRTFEQYERYIGVKFKTRQIHKETKDNEFAPIKADFEKGLSFVQKQTISVYKPSIPLKDYTFFAVALLDENYNDIHREDATREEIYRLINENPSDHFIHMIREYVNEKRPYAWRVWPYSESQGWQDKIEQVIKYE